MTPFNDDIFYAHIFYYFTWSKYCHPVLLVTKTEDGMWEGSGRNYDKSTFHNFKDYLNDSGLVEYAEGHQSAFGIGIKDENI